MSPNRGLIIYQIKKIIQTLTSQFKNTSCNIIFHKGLKIYSKLGIHVGYNLWIQSLSNVLLSSILFLDRIFPLML